MLSKILNHLPNIFRQNARESNITSPRVFTNFLFVIFFFARVFQIIFSSKVENESWALSGQQTVGSEIKIIMATEPATSYASNLIQEVNKIQVILLLKKPPWLFNYKIQNL